MLSVPASCSAQCVARTHCRMRLRMDGEQRDASKARQVSGHHFGDMFKQGIRGALSLVARSLRRSRFMVPVPP